MKSGILINVRFEIQSLTHTLSFLTLIRGCRDLFRQPLMRVWGVDAVFQQLLEYKFTKTSLQIPEGRL